MLLRTAPTTTRPSDTALVSALAVLGATAVGWRWAGRPEAVRTITMGPGGWVSFKGFPPGTGRRPWWARLLRAEPLPSAGRRGRRQGRRRTT